MPKQYAMVGGAAMLERTVGVFVRSPLIDAVVVAIAADDRHLYEDAFGSAPSAKLLAPVTGGETRQHSVLRGLRALAPLKPDRILIHDGARPFVTEAIIERALAATETASAAVVAMPLSDTLKRADAAGRVVETLNRTGLWRAQTPQVFRFPEILAAHEAAASTGNQEFTDDAAVAEWAGHTVVIVEGSETNYKITTAEDLAMVRNVEPNVPDIRTGQGFDVHRLVPGDHVWLCGVRIAHAQGLEGHSDADVGLHALTDALLGAISDGDIGQHFPNTDARWRGAASHVFLAEAARRVRARGGTIANADVTLLCEAPKVAPHREAMRHRISDILGIAPQRVSIKATTTEGLGFTGRREGIAALATATVILR